MFILFQFIPILIIILILFLFKKEISWIEVFILIIMTSIITTSGYYIGIFNKTSDTEYWSNEITQLTFEEYWETYIHQTCQEEYDCNCSTDTLGVKSCDTCTRSVDCSYCDEHPEKYIGSLNSGANIFLTKKRGREIIYDWKESEQYINKHRNINNYLFCGKDGDAYKYSWNSDISSSQIFVSSHVYENRVQASNNIHSDYREYDVNLTYPYPIITNGGKQKHLIGWDNEDIEKYIQYWNGKYGMMKQIKFFVYVWDDETSINIVEDQKARYNKCNKNEFILCLFVNDNGIIKNLDFITWSESNFDDVKKLKNLNINDVIIETSNILLKKWKRYEFSNFDHLLVEPSITTFFVTFLINILFNYILGYYFYQNETI